MSLVAEQETGLFRQIQFGERRGFAVKRAAVDGVAVFPQRAHDRRRIVGDIHRHIKQRAHRTAQRFRVVQIRAVGHEDQRVYPERRGGAHQRSEIARVLHGHRHQKIPPEILRKIKTIVYCSKFLRFVKCFCDTKQPFGRFFFGELVINALRNAKNAAIFRQILGHRAILADKNAHKIDLPRQRLLEKLFSFKEKKPLFFPAFAVLQGDRFENFRVLSA